MTAHDVLVNARNHLAQHQWCQCVLQRSDGGACALGAICLVSPDTAPRIAAHRALATLLDVDLRTGVTVWNDKPGRTKEEVLALFDEAIRQTAPAPDTSFLKDRIAEREQNTAFFGPMFEEAKS